MLIKNRCYFRRAFVFINTLQINLMSYSTTWRRRCKRKPMPTSRKVRRKAGENPITISYLWLVESKPLEVQYREHHHKDDCTFLRKFRSNTLTKHTLRFFLERCVTKQQMKFEAIWPHFILKRTEIEDRRTIEGR